MRITKLHRLLTPILLGMLVPLYAANAGVTPLLTAEEQADLLFMREEEKLARDTYLTFYDEYGMEVFSNIASSEQKHMDAMLKLLKKYNLADPAAGNEIGEFDNPSLQALYYSLMADGLTGGLAALLAGGLIEETDMRDIVDAIEDSQQDHIDAVYSQLLCGSRNHLRAFAQNIEVLTGLPYEAQVLNQEEVDAILESPMEQCGKKPRDARGECQGKCLGRDK